MRDKKIIKIITFALMFIFAFSVSMVFAEVMPEARVTSLDDQINENEINVSNKDSIIDTDAITGVYRFSEHKSPYLPFVRFCSDRIVVDSDVSKSGILFSQRSINVENKMEKAQVFFAAEAIRINENIDYALMFSGTNTIIDSVVNGDILVFAGDTFTISETGKVNGDVIVFASNIDIKGSVQGSVVGVADKVKVTGTVQTDLRIDEASSVELGETSIFGNVYISTTNPNMDLGTNYSDATIKVIKNEIKSSFDIIEVLKTGVISSLIFAIIYFILNKASKGKLYDMTLNKIKNNSMFVVVFGCFFVILLPITITLLFILSIIGAYAISVPIMIAVIAYVLICGLLSTFVVGSTMSHYMSEKYYKEQNEYIKAFASFIIFFVLHILARLPKVGGYITIILVILSLGIVASLIFTKKIKKEVIEEKNKDKNFKDEENKN